MGTDYWSLSWQWQGCCGCGGKGQSGRPVPTREMWVRGKGQLFSAVRIFAEKRSGEFWRKGKEFGGDYLDVSRKIWVCLHILGKVDNIRLLWYTSFHKNERMFVNSGNAVWRKGQSGRPVPTRGTREIYGRMIPPLQKGRRNGYFRQKKGDPGASGDRGYAAIWGISLSQKMESLRLLSQPPPFRQGGLGENKGSVRWKEESNLHSTGRSMRRSVRCQRKAD